MLYATTPAAKIALAASLEEHDKDFLKDLKWLSAELGKFESVGYQSDSKETQRAVVAGVEAARIARKERARLAGEEAIRLAKESLA